MAAEEVEGMVRMLGGRKRQKREVKETRVDRWLSLPPIGLSGLESANSADSRPFTSINSFLEMTDKE